MRSSGEQQQSASANGVATYRYQSIYISRDHKNTTIRPRATIRKTTCNRNNARDHKNARACSCKFCPKQVHAEQSPKVNTKHSACFAAYALSLARQVGGYSSVTDGSR